MNMDNCKVIKYYELDDIASPLKQMKKKADNKLLKPDKTVPKILSLF